MKIDRGEVGVWLSECADYDAVAVDSPKLAALCRLALEVMDAPEGVATCCCNESGDWLEVDGIRDASSMHGKRVRLVRVQEGL